MHHIVSDGWSAGRALAGNRRAIRGVLPGPSPRRCRRCRSSMPIMRPAAKVAAGSGTGATARLLGRGAAPARPRSWRFRPIGLGRLDAELCGATASHSSLDEGVSRSLQDLCRQEGVTLFMPLLAAFQALLHRYTGQVDLVVGTDVANRTPLETEKLIGFFLNHLVLRSDLSGDPELSCAARPGAGDSDGRLRPSGSPVRQAGRGAEAGTEPESTRRFFRSSLLFRMRRGSRSNCRV